MKYLQLLDDGKLTFDNNELETISSAQTKANQAENNAKNAATSALNGHTGNKSNPHNVTSEQVTLIDAKPGTANASTYPIGVTTFPVTDLNGYPSKYGTVITTRYNNSRGGQTFFNKEGSVYTRTIHEAGTNGWTGWLQQETVSGSASRATAARDEAISRAVAQDKAYTDDKNDYEVYWTDATWRSGHGGDLKWCIIGGFLVVKGMWNNTGETGVQIASVPAAPKYRTYINAPTIGSYGGARTTLGNDGVITVDGMNANNNSSVSRIEILFVIPVESRG
jgi:hypothetical protein